MATSRSDRTLTASQRARVITRAVAAWHAGKPHTAWQTLADAGMGAYWPMFQRVALRHARKRYTRAMPKRGAS